MDIIITFALLGVIAVFSYMALDAARHTK